MYRQNFGFIVFCGLECENRNIRCDTQILEVIAKYTPSISNN